MILFIIIQRTIAWWSKYWLMALLPKCPIFVYLENVSSRLPIEFDVRWPWIFWKLFLIGGCLGFGVMWMVLTSCAAPTLPPNILLSRWKPSCGEGMLGNLTDSDIADVKLFNPDWNLLRELWSFLMNWPFLGIGVVKIGTWNRGWLLFLCSTRPTAVVPVLTPGSLS